MRLSVIYRKKLKQATPPRADLEKIREIYKEAKRLTRESGVQYSVDHRIPLRGPLVWGLHVHNNLQILLHVANMQKGNNAMDQLEMFE